MISGQQLPKPGGGKKGEIIDPYVKIQIGGIGEDSQAVKTKVVNDNGMNVCPFVCTYVSIIAVYYGSGN